MTPSLCTFIFCRYAFITFAYSGIDPNFCFKCCDKKKIDRSTPRAVSLKKKCRVEKGSISLSEVHSVSNGPGMLSANNENGSWSYLWIADAILELWFIPVT